MATALEANSPEKWDRIWSDPAEAEWRERVLGAVYDRIVELVPKGSQVVDLGGGVGTLAARLAHERECHGSVWDSSWEAVRKARELHPRLAAYQVDLNEPPMTGQPPQYCWKQQLLRSKDTLYVSTECFEHLSERVRKTWFLRTKRGRGLLVSVPNNRLGPDEEPQHTRKWTAKEFLDELREHFGANCRVEVLGPFLLGVCGKIAAKPFTLSVCTPVRDEEVDLERTLASFRGVADELVVGVDCRTKDRSREVARQYADVVFDIEDPNGPPDDEAPQVHFAHVRNRCIERCTSDWIFMTEAHEGLKAGRDALLNLDQLSDGAKVAFVMRTGSGQRWAYPWLHRRDSRIRYKRATHNVLDFPPEFMCVRLPQIETLHQRVAGTIERRKEQRRVQNRKTLTEDWVQRGNENSLLYLGSEWSEYNKDRAIQRLKEYLAVNRSSGAARYHARMQCAKLLAQNGDREEARSVLINAASDDWSRVDHFFYLGDLALEDGKYEEALQFYRYVATRLNDPPFCVWWIDLNIYGYLTAQRLTECYAWVGKLDEALQWAEKVIELLPEDSPAEAFDEARQNIERISEAIAKNAA